jgi:hypothetical protein
MKQHPFSLLLFSIYPSLALLTWNLREVEPTKIILRPLLFSVVIALVFCLILFRIARSSPKAILRSTVFIISFLAEDILQSPLNTFRVIFNMYFGADYPMLKDESIKVGINRPYGKKIMKPSPCP